MKRRTIGQYSPADQPLIEIRIGWDEAVDEIAQDLIAEMREKVEALRRAGAFGYCADIRHRGATAPG